MPNARIASRLVAAGTVMVGLAFPDAALGQDDPKGQLQIGPDFGLIARPAKDDAAGISYGTGIAYGAHAQILTAPWLRFSLYYLRARQPVTMPAGSLLPGTAVEGDPHLGSYVLGARIQPTLNLGQRLHLWANAGAGWGKVTVPAMKLTQGADSMRVGPRDGVLVEIPVGVGGSFDIIRRWLAVSIDATYAFSMKQSGDAYREAQVVDAKGEMLHVGPMPKLGSAVTGTISLVVEL